MYHLPNWMVIYGTDRNSGKTTFATRLIERFCQKMPVCALKITPHFHPVNEEQIVYRNPHCVMIREYWKETGKDSARMLKAGAHLVYYIQVWDQHLGELMPELLKRIPGNTAVICESGWIRSLVNPGLFFILHRKDNPDIKESVSSLKPLANEFIEFDGQNFNFDISTLNYSKNTWSVEQK